MAVYFQGAEAEDFVVTGGETLTSTAGYNASNARASIRQRGVHPTNYAATPTFSANDFWVHFNAEISWNFDAINNTSPYVLLVSGGTPYLGIGLNGSSQHTILVWNGSSWVATATGTAITWTSGRNIFDFYVKVGTAGTGQVRLYRNGAPYCSNTTTVDTTFAGAVSNFAEMRLVGPSTGTNNTVLYYSEVIVADYNTIGSKLVTITPNAAGNYTGFTSGAYTDIDEAVLDASDASSGTVGQRISAGFTDLSALATGEAITSVKASAAMSKDAGGPQSANLFTRISTTDYDGTSVAAPASLTATPQVTQVWATNPATATAWTVSDINAAQFGVKSNT